MPLEGNRVVSVHNIMLHFCQSVIASLHSSLELVVLLFLLSVEKCAFVQELDPKIW